MNITAETVVEINQAVQELIQENEKLKRELETYKRDCADLYKEIAGKREVIEDLFSKIHELVDRIDAQEKIHGDKANEAAMMFAPAEEDKADRKLFVKNLGWLLSQTRDGVQYCDLDDNEIVTIHFRGGGVHKVNINMDSYAAIVRDVAKGVT